ncbi:MAG: DEAD/DEAH box helicase [Nitrospiraceae bacterium]
MTTDELEKLLVQQPLGLLHRLARGRVHRHFRFGKRRIIEALLRASAEQRPAFESDLMTLIEERSRRQQDSPAADERLPLSGTASSSPQPGRHQTSRQERQHHTAGRAAHSQPTHTADADSKDPGVSLAAFLDGIGIPKPAPFVPDPWQEEALAHLVDTDVIVSVPTGSGKTYVAVEATRRAIAANRTVIYTSPLKALSNTKFTEFSRIFGAEQVGILTGDRRDNTQAPLLIMTTEILRNLLYDAAGGEIDLRLDTLGLVILDESQYLADRERGVVWEETIIFCPSQAKLLLLSASIGNPQDIADWLTQIRPAPCRLVQHSKRTVPLRAGYLHPNGKLTPLFRTIGIPVGQRGSLHPETVRLFHQYEQETTGRGR